MPTTTKTIKPGTRVERGLTFERAQVDVAARTVELAFSSETPYERWWGIEVLDNTAPAVRLGRLTSGGPLLMDHDTRDQVGVIESVRIDADRVGRAVVRFGKSARAEEVWQDVQDGIRRNVSVGYAIHKATLVETSDTGADTYRITDWEPLEISLVSVPADASVGIGRSAADGGDNPIQILKEQRMSEATQTSAPAAPVDHSAIERAAIERAHQDATKRAADIIAIGEMFAKQGGERKASEALRAGKSVEQFRADMLQHMATQPIPTADIGMTDKEARSYSFLRALNAMANPGDRKAQELAAFEREASEAVAAKQGRAARGFYVPTEVQRRDLNAGAGAAGGNTVATNLLAASFIELLRNKMAVTGLGAQFLSGLQGNIAIPRQTGGATAYWVAESAAPTESQAAFDQVTMSPKTVGAYSDISRKLLLQSSLDVEGFVRNDLATVLALAIDQAAISGTAANDQPRGILSTSGIGDVAGGANGLAPTWAHMVELESDVAIANADVGSMGYLTNAKVRGKLKTTSKVSGQNGFIWEDGMVNGYNAAVSNQVPSNLTKGTSSGVASAIIFGNWSDLIIGQWGTLDLMVDPYSGSTSGTVRVVALQDVDIAVRHAVSFSAMLDALTV
ncbi:phage major capsid protein [Comamonas aquatica]|uniref:phage major capsid protein n=1 Tax=Comamonas aquatica TaxID=225991 RepID=UPI0021B114AE|nr:phage major capsid protein [Comamonas aquatica]